MVPGKLAYPLASVVALAVIAPDNLFAGKMLSNEYETGVPVVGTGITRILMLFTSPRLLSV
jgi:hypothetical protein